MQVSTEEWHFHDLKMRKTKHWSHLAFQEQHMNVRVMGNAIIKEGLK